MKVKSSLVFLLSLMLFLNCIITAQSETSGPGPEQMKTQSTAGSQEVDPNNLFIYRVLEDQTAQIDRYVGDESHVVIPDTLNGIRVSAIGEKAFSNQKVIKSMVISEGVVRIGDGAFDNCRQLETIILPGSITDIGKEAFEKCESLITIDIPESVSIIKEGTFKFCKSLRKVNIPDSVTKISNEAFYECESLRYILLPDSITEIGEWAFAGCSKLDDLVIPGSVEIIGESAFWECALYNVAIQEGVQVIGKGAFCNCSSLYSISIPSSVKEIGDIAFFYNRYRTVTVFTPEGSYADRYARREFYLEPDHSYREPIVSYPAQKTNCDDALEYGPYYYNIYADDTVEIVRYTGNDKEVIIPEMIDGHQVSMIGDGAFDSCDKLVCVIIPDSVIHVGANPFSACVQLSVIKVSVENPALAVINGVLFSKADKCLVSYPAGKQETEYSIPQGIRNIGPFAFYGCSVLKKVSLPESVETIGKEAFRRCRGLQGLNLPGSISSIGEKALARVSDGIEVLVNKGSYAEQYCMENNLGIGYPDSLDWLND